MLQDNLSSKVNFKTRVVCEKIDILKTSFYEILDQKMKFFSQYEEYCFFKIGHTDRKGPAVNHLVKTFWL